MAVTKWRSLDQRRILKTVLRFVDREGIEALSIRNLGAEVRVEAVSFSSHVPNKSAARRDGGGAAGQAQDTARSRGLGGVYKGGVPAACVRAPIVLPLVVTLRT